MALTGSESMSQKQFERHQRRAIALSDLRIMEGEEDTRRLEFSASSEYPVSRWWGQEILDHSSGAVDLSRLNDGAAFLFNHSPSDYLGVIERAWMDSGKLRCQVRFDTHERAEQIYQSVKAGILRGISIGYEIMEWEETHQANSSVETYRITRWMPYEASLVTVPADPTVGVGRQIPVVEPTPSPMKNELNAPTPATGETRSVEPSQPATPVAPAAPAPNPDDFIAEERSRIQSLQALGTRFEVPSEETNRWINTGVSVESARALVLERLSNQQTPVAKPANPVGLSEKEQRQYSLRKAILALTIPDFADKAGFEREISQEIGRSINRPSSGIYIPLRDLAADPTQTRDAYSVSVTAGGGQMVDTVLDTGRLIEFLRNRMLITRMGAELLSGLEGDLEIPRVTGTSNVYWVGAEGGSLQQSRGSFGSIKFQPKTLGVISSYTRQLLLQSSIDIEGWIRRDLTASMALEIDRACINGNGQGGQPTGILNASGVTTLPIATNGGPLSYGNVVDLMSLPATQNADIGTQYFLTNPKVRGLALQTEVATATGRFLFEMGTEPAMGRLIGMPCGVTNQVPSDLTKGNGTGLSPLIFGNFQDLMIGEWGVLELLPNPYGAGYESGAIEIRALQTIDIQLRRPESFAAIKDIVTTI